MIYIGNAFSLNMLAHGHHQITVRPVTRLAEIPTNAISVVGHAGTVSLISAMLNRTIECNRTTLTLTPGDTLYVAQYMGERLPEGATSLPLGSTLTWLKVEVCVELPGGRCQDVPSQSIALHETQWGGDPWDRGVC